MKKYSTIIFDLDGTISCSDPGIIKSIVQAMEDYEISLPHDFELKNFIGPPITKTLEETLYLDAHVSQQVLERYREYYRNGNLFLTSMYDGVENLLHTLKNEGYTLALATSKPHDMTVRVVEKLGLTPLFSYMACASMHDKAGDKSILIEEVLENLKIDKNDALMVGDTLFDSHAAKKVGMDFLGVLYGYGKKEHLEAEPYVFIANHADEILTFLQG